MKKPPVIVIVLAVLLVSNGVYTYLLQDRLYQIEHQLEYQLTVMGESINQPVQELQAEVTDVKLQIRQAKSDIERIGREIQAMEDFESRIQVVESWQAAVGPVEDLVDWMDYVGRAAYYVECAFGLP